MFKPLLIIVNGPPGAGKTTLARRLAADTSLPVLHRDGIVETLFDALDCQVYGRPALIGFAGFQLLHYFAGALLAAGQSLIVEGYIGSSQANAEFLQLRASYDYEPLQIQCYADGKLLLERFLARSGSPERHIYHRDLAFVEQNREVFRRGCVSALALGGQVLDVDMSDIAAYDYAGVLATVRQALTAHRAERPTLSDV